MSVRIRPLIPWNSAIQATREASRRKTPRWRLSNVSSMTRTRSDFHVAEEILGIVVRHRTVSALADNGCCLAAECRSPGRADFTQGS